MPSKTKSDLVMNWVNRIWDALLPKKINEKKHFDPGDGYTILRECKGETVEFTYQKYNAPNERRKIDLLAILQDSRGNLYLFGRCHARQENRTFNIDKITTMLKINSKRIYANEYLEETYSLD